MKLSRILILIFVFCFCVSCQKNKINENSKGEFKKERSIENKSQEKELIENFDDFNKKFHSDSIFQISRVDFPIDGEHVSGFKQYKWNRKNWQFQAIPVSEKNEIGEYEHSLEKSDTLVIEKFWIPNSGFEVERRFKLIKNKWFLIYYNDINL